MARRAASLATFCTAFLSTTAAAPQREDLPVLVVDLHVDVPWQVHFKGRDPKLAEGMVRSDTLQKGAYVGVVLPIYLPDSLNETGPRIADAEAVLATIDRIAGQSPVLLPLRSPEVKSGRVATWLAIEGAGAFAEDLARIDDFIARGVRLVGPVHAKNGPLASSATGERTSVGLTDVGKRFCDRVYEKGALVDVSHMSDAAFADLVPIARRHGAPIVATHSNARAIAASPRNLTDEQLRIIRDTGGVAGLNFHAPFVSGKKRATIDEVVEMAEHMIHVAGIDHVAIGSDFDGGIRPPDGLADASALPRLARALEKRGLSHDDVLKVFSLNALRVLAWRPRGGVLEPPKRPAAEPVAGPPPRE